MGNSPLRYARGGEFFCKWGFTFGFLNGVWDTTIIFSYNDTFWWNGA